MTRFIYAFRREDAEELQKLGYEMLQEDKDKGAYVFLNSDKLCFSAIEGRFATGNTLTF